MWCSGFPCPRAHQEAVEEVLSDPNHLGRLGAVDGTRAKKRRDWINELPGFWGTWKNYTVFT